jgi:DNA replication protein DnaC
MSDENNIMDADDKSMEPHSRLLMRLQLSNVRNHYHELAQTAAEQGWSHLEYLKLLIEGEIAHRDDKSLERRVRLARFPLFKTLDQFQWSWPKKINRPRS